MAEFHYTLHAREVIFAAGALDRLGEAVERFGWQRILLCTSPSQNRAGRVSRLEAALGGRLRAIYDSVQPHVQDFQLAEALSIAELQEVDVVMGLGGGSSIGMAKAVSHRLEAKPSEGFAPPAERPLVPVFAIPTTYAGSEMTPVYGVTGQQNGENRKLTVSDPRIAPRLVLYDPQLTLDLPPEVTAATGINALAHCLEALYSITRNPLSTAAALSGLRHIFFALPKCYTTGEDLQARTEMMIGSHLAGTALAGVAMGLHHGLCHVLGGTAGVPHGAANSIMLPHAMRFNLEAAATELAPAAGAMGIPTDGRKPVQASQILLDKVSGLIEELALPRRLRDVGVQQADLPRLAELALQSRAVQSNPRPIRDAREIQTVLSAAW